MISIIDIAKRDVIVPKRPNLQFLSLEFAFTAHKIIAWQFHLFAIEQLVHLLVEKGSVHGFDAFKVIFSVLVQWGVDTIYEIVVGAERVRM